MRYKQFLFPEEQKKKNEWFKKTWKWTKIVLGMFLIVSTIWGCGQMLGDPNVSTKSITSILDFKNHNFAAVFFELLVGTSDVTKNHIFHMGSDGLIHEYTFNGIRTWSQAWSETKNPFYGLFVYPIAWLLVSVAHGLSGSNTGPVNPIALIFSIFFTTLIIKLITLVFTFKAQQNQERMQSVQMKTAEIQAKYKYSRDMYAKQKQQQELMAVYRKEGINPIASFIPMFLSIPFLTGMYIVVKSTNLLKTTQIGLIKLIETPWSMITQGQWIYLVLIFVYLPIQAFSMFLPLLLNRSKQKVKTKESKAAIKKQIIMQVVFIALMVAFVFAAPAGVAIYWIISGWLQILQTFAFHQYNKYRKNIYKRKGFIKESFGQKLKRKYQQIIYRKNKPKKPKYLNSFYNYNGLN